HCRKTFVCSLGGIVRTYPAPFFAVIPSLFNSVIFACASLILATSSAKAEPQGFFEGHLKIIAPKEVELADVTQSKTKEKCADYPLIVLSKSDRKESALVTADEHGNYRAPLPPGNYVLDIQDRMRRRV